MFSIFKDIRNFAYTRKFWTAVVTGFITSLLIIYGSDVPEWVSVLVLTAGALGVYQVPNAKK